MSPGVKASLVLTLLISILQAPAIAASTPHGAYSSSSTLCSLCHAPHDSTSTEDRHNSRFARIEEANTDVTYTGSWAIEAHDSKSSSSSIESSQTGASAELSFRASQIVWLATKTPASGRARVLLDGVVQNDIDLYNDLDQYQGRVWQKTGLSAGDHSIEIRALGTKSASSSGYSIDIDAFDISVPKIMLLKGTSEKAVCYTCHAGIGSIYNVAEQFGETTNTSPPVSKHPVPEASVLCSDCHSPHASAENWDADRQENEVVRLLRSIYTTFMGFVVSPANSWLSTPEPANVSLGIPEQRRLAQPYEQCGSCHGAGSTLPGGDILKYYRAGGVKHDDTSSVSLESEAEIACMACHEWHVSSLPKLLETTIFATPITANDNNVCYSCHKIITPAINSYDDSVSGDVHGATESTNTSGSAPGFTGPYDYRMEQISCLVCHDTHGSPNIFWVRPAINSTSGISLNGTSAADRAGWEGFCSACHLYSHDSTSTYDVCVACHFHGAGGDSSPTTKF